MTEHLPTRVAKTPSRGPDRRKLILLSLAAIAAALPGQAQTEKKPFSPAELDQMLAPIALYPDSLLSQILMACGLSPRDRRGGALAPGQSQRQGRCRGQGRRRQELGCQREIAGRLPVRPVAAQRASRLDAKDRRCADRTAAGCRHLDPAPARQGGGGRQPEERQGANRHHPNPGQRDRLRHSADRSRSRLCAELRSQHRLWPVARLQLSADLLSSDRRMLRRRRVAPGPDMGGGHRGGRRDVQQLELARQQRQLRERQRQPCGEHRP